MSAPIERSRQIAHAFDVPPWLIDGRIRRTPVEWTRFYVRRPLRRLRAWIRAQ